MEFSLLGSAAIGVFGFWVILRYEAKRGNAAGCAVDLWDAGIVSAVAGLFAGRIAAMLAAGIDPLTNPAQIILIRSGVSTTVTALVTIATFALLSRKDLIAAADGISAAALAGLVELYTAAIVVTAAVGIALWKQHGRPPAASPAGVALIAASGARLVTEPLRISLSGGPVLLYAAGVAVGTAVVIWSVVARRSSRATPGDPAVP
jgi:hypothetical protein